MFAYAIHAFVHIMCVVFIQNIFFLKKRALPVSMDSFHNFIRVNGGLTFWCKEIKSDFAVSI